MHHMPEIGIVQQIDIDKELQDAYLDYAMSVIVSRALPDVRDGLKPVHRRILYAMYDMGLHPDRPYKKSARIVGEVLGKYHPHGDSAVYDAMVRMAQDFSMRYRLVDGQGNFGSIDGDNAAAMRYTEARLANPAMEMLSDIQKDTVDFSFNFDGTLREPDVLPAMLPNLLINGGDGIAVGMSTKIPPHNIGEICDALDYMIERWDALDDVTVEDLMRFVRGPDFPSGGLIYRYRDDVKQENNDTILNAYATGRGRIVVQAKTHVEEMSRNRSRIVVTELPFQTNKANLIERIADLARDGKVDGITDLRDESDRRGMRVVIELTRNVSPTVVLGHLFKLTPLRQTFGVIMLALVDGQPRLLSLKRALVLFVEHRRKVIRRRSEYDLERARARAHILEGLRIALDNLNKVIETIRRSQRVETARTNLIKNFKLTEKQAQAVLDMRLARLAALERKKIEDEYAAVQEEIKYLEGLLASDAAILDVIRAELKELKKRYNDPRRTLIITEAEFTGDVLRDEDLVPDGPVLVTITTRGEIQRIMNVARKPRGGSSYSQILVARNRGELLLINKDGRAWRTSIHQLPEKTGQSKGELLSQLLGGWERGDDVAAALDVPADEAQLAGRYLIVVTRNGRTVRVAAEEVKNLHAGTLLANVEDKDEVIWAGLSGGKDHLLLASAQGQAIQFSEDDVRPTGLGVQGVWGMKLEAKNDAVVGAGLATEGDALLVVSERGMHKRTPLADYPVQGRYGKGVRAMNLDATSGPLAAAAVVNASDRLSFHTNKRATHDVQARHVPQVGRYPQGQNLPDLPADQRVEKLLKWGNDQGWEAPPAGTESASREESNGSDSDKKGQSSGRKAGRTLKPARVSKPAQANNEPPGASKGGQLSLDIAGPPTGTEPSAKKRRSDTPASRRKK
jgi:DNA gyrase subunit A